MASAFDRSPRVGVAAAIGLVWFSGDSERIDSLAVLPFENGSADPDTEYFSDGVTESIISSLSQLPHVKVISRNSAFHYKGRTIDAKAVGRELDVEALSCWAASSSDAMNYPSAPS